MQDLWGKKLNSYAESAIYRHGDNLDNTKHQKT